MQTCYWHAVKVCKVCTSRITSSLVAIISQRDLHCPPIEWASSEVASVRLCLVWGGLRVDPHRVAAAQAQGCHGLGRAQFSCRPLIGSFTL